MKEYEKWFKKAEQDLFVIKNIINIIDAPYEICCFHAQQAAEKYLKAYLTAHNVDFLKTHMLFVRYFIKFKKARELCCYPTLS